MENAKDINLDSVVSYVTNTHNFLRQNSAYFEQVKIALEATLNKN
jgi:hypothetical protein